MLVRGKQPIHNGQKGTMCFIKTVMSVCTYTIEAKRDVRCQIIFKQAVLQRNDENVQKKQERTNRMLILDYVVVNVCIFL